MRYPKSSSESVVFRELFTNAAYMADNGGVVTTGVSNIVNETAVFRSDWCVNYKDEDVVNVLKTGVFSLRIVQTISNLGSEGGAMFGWYVDDNNRFYIEVPRLSINNQCRMIYNVNGGGVAVAFGSTHSVSDGCNDIILICNGATWTHYINGVASTVGGTTADLARMVGRGDFTIDGQSGGSATGYGDVHKVEIYDRVLSAEEAKDLYEEDTFTEIDASKAELWLPLESAFNDGTNIVTENLGGLTNLLWGNGAGTGEPTLLEDGGLDFSSGDVYLKSAPISMESLSESISVGGLFKFNSISGTQSLLQNENNWQMAYVNTFGVGFLIRDAAGDYHNYSIAGLPTIGKWTHMVCTYDGTNATSGIKVYFDGVVQTPTLTSWQGDISDGSDSFAVGINASTYNTAAFDGSVKLPFILREKLTPTQIKELSNRAFRSING